MEEKAITQISEEQRRVERRARSEMLWARSEMMTRLPFFATMSLSLSTKPDYTVRSVATDGKCLKYNPNWTANTNRRDIISAIAACVSSCALQHHIRQGMRRYGRWQKACNMVVAKILKQQLIIEGRVETSDASAERTYDRLEDDAAPAMAGAASSSQDNIPEDATLKEWEQNDPSGRLGEIQSNPNASGEEIRDESERWSNIVMGAIQHAKRQGYDPGLLAEAVFDLMTPVIDWKSVMRSLFMEFTKVRDTWNRPNRRLIGQGIYLPGSEGHGCPPIAFAVDTSGSMSNQELAEVWAEVRACAEAVEPDLVHVIQCDAAVASHEIYECEDLPVELNARGRGGTRFTPVFELLEQDWTEEPIACLVYLSDLYCNDYPSVPPDYPVIWVGSTDSSPVDPPFGTRVNINQDD